MLAIIKKPGAHPSDEREMVLQSFETVLPERKNRQRVDRAVTVLLGYLAEEVWALPELQGVYMLQFQRMTAEAAYLCVFQRDVSGRQDLWCDRWPRMKDTLTDYADIRAVVAAWSVGTGVCA